MTAYEMRISDWSSDVCSSDLPGVFRDLFPRGQHGLHHMALYCDDYEAERDAYHASGAELAYEAHVGPTRTCWVDTAATLGFMVELLEPSPIREKGFAMMRTAAQRWDGKDPITRF